MMMLQGTALKALLKSKKTTINALPMPTKSSLSSQKGIKFVRHDFINFCWLLTVTLLFLVCLETSSTRIGLPSSQESRWGWPACSLSGSLLPFLKRGVTLAFSKSPGNFPNHHDLWKTVEQPSNDISQLPQHHGRTASGLMDFRIPRLFKCSLDLFASTISKLFVLQIFPLISEAWDPWRQILWGKNKAKKVLNTLACSMSFFTRSPALITGGPTLFLLFLLLNLKKLFLLSFTFLAKINCRWTPTFLTLSLHTLY